MARSLRAPPEHGGDMRISSYDEEVVRPIGLGEEIMDEYRDTFRALAK